MGLPKFIPKTVFQVIASVLLLGSLGLVAFWAATGSGLYADIADGIAGDDGTYDVGRCLIFTTLTLIIPVIPVIFLLRLFSTMPTIKQQLTEDPWLNKITGGAPAAPAGHPPLPGSQAVLSAAVRCLPLAPLWTRLLAFTVDRLVVAVVVLAAAVPTFYAREALGTAWVVASFVVFFVVLAMGLFYAYARDAAAGQSMGRLLLGIQVVYVDTGKPIGPGASFKRELLLHLLLPVELLLLLADQRRQRLGDRWARTLVVKIDR